MTTRIRDFMGEPRTAAELKFVAAVERRTEIERRRILAAKRAERGPMPVNGFRGKVVNRGAKSGTVGERVLGR